MAVPNWVRARTQTTKLGTRSGLEDQIINQLTQIGIKAEYEIGRIPYIKGTAHYTPDFCLPNGIIIETKGLFLPADRTKHLLIQSQIPNLDIRFVFNNPNARLSKKSKTTYAEWCIKHHFKYATGLIPAEWFTEKVSDSLKWTLDNVLVLKKPVKDKCVK